MGHALQIAHATVPGLCGNDAIRVPILALERICHYAAKSSASRDSRFYWIDAGNPYGT
jgi:hypothetical protein